MTPQAATELLDVIMLDDLVARRKALDTWTRRWIATMQIFYDMDSEFSTHSYYRQVVKNFLRTEMQKGLEKDEVHALSWKTEEREDFTRTILEMFVLLQEPRAT